MPDNTQNAAGPHAWDDALKPMVEDVLESIMMKSADTKLVQSIVKALGPLAPKGAKLLPMALAYGLAKVPDKALGGSEVADFIRDVVVEAARNLDEVVAAAGQVTPEQWHQSVAEAAKKVGETNVYVDDFGHFHLEDCVKLLEQISRHEAERTARQQNRHQPVRRGPDGKPLPPDQQPPPQQAETNLPRFNIISRAAALKQGLKPSPCCVNRVEESSAAVPAKPKKFRSPGEVIGASSKEQKERLAAVRSKLTGKSKKSFDIGLGEVDSLDELEAILVIAEMDDPELMMNLLEDHNAGRVVKDVLKGTGKAVSTAAKAVSDTVKTAYQDLKAADDALAPKVAAELQKFQNQHPPAPRKIKWSLRRMLGIW